MKGVLIIAMFKKTVVVFLSLIILFSLLCACQSSQAQDEESTKNSTNITETAEMDNIPQWKTAYLKFLEERKDSHLSYALIYIDGDDIPELYLSGKGEAIGDSICAYKNGAVIEQQLHRIGGGWYIEKSGNIVNRNGHMGQKHTHVYKLVEDGFVLTFEALSSERINDEGKLYFEYSIGDTPVSESEYNHAVENAVELKNAVRLNENEVNYDTIRQQIIDFN